MKFHFILGFFFFSSLFSEITDNLDIIQEYSSSAVCEIIGFDDETRFFTWQAFFIDTKGFLLSSRIPDTCRHFYCYWQDEDNQLDLLEGKWICDHPDYNVALIKIDFPENKKFPVLLMDFSPLNSGDWLLRLTVDAKNRVAKPSLCQISSYAEEVQDGLLLHEGIVDQGSQKSMQGAPYFNLKGKVVAVHNRSDKRFSTFTALYPLKDWLCNLGLEIKK